MIICYTAPNTVFVLATAPVKIQAEEHTLFRLRGKEQLMFRKHPEGGYLGFFSKHRKNAC